LQHHAADTLLHGAFLRSYFNDIGTPGYEKHIPAFSCEKKQTYIFSIHTSKDLLDATINYIISIYTLQYNSMYVYFIFPIRLTQTYACIKMDST